MHARIGANYQDSDSPYTVPLYLQKIIQTRSMIQRCQNTLIYSF